MRLPTTENIIDAATVAFNITIDELKSRSRKRRILRPRQTVQYMCVRMMTDTLNDIAHKTGVKQHGTVASSHRLIDNDVGMYYDVARYVQMIEDTLESQGFDTGKAVTKAEISDYYDPFALYSKKHIPVKVMNTETDEYCITNSLNAAARLTGVNRSAITNECRKMGKALGIYRFSYDYDDGE